jgi:hypothetical protein
MYRKEDNIKMGLKETGCDCGLDSCSSEQSPLTGCCEHGNKVPGFIKRREIRSRMTLFHDVCCLWREYEEELYQVRPDRNSIATQHFG